MESRSGFDLQAWVLSAAAAAGIAGPMSWAEEVRQLGGAVPRGGIVQTGGSGFSPLTKTSNGAPARLAHVDAAPIPLQPVTNAQPVPVYQPMPNSGAIAGTATIQPVQFSKRGSSSPPKDVQGQLEDMYRKSGREMPNFNTNMAGSMAPQGNEGGNQYVAQNQNQYSNNGGYQGQPSQGNYAPVSSEAPKEIKDKGGVSGFFKKLIPGKSVATQPAPPNTDPGPNSAPPPGGQPQNQGYYNGNTPNGGNRMPSNYPGPQNQYPNQNSFQNGNSYPGPNGGYQGNGQQFGNGSPSGPTGYQGQNYNAGNNYGGGSGNGPHLNSAPVGLPPAPNTNLFSPHQPNPAMNFQEPPPVPPSEFTDHSGRHPQGVMPVNSGPVHSPMLEATPSPLNNNPTQLPGVGSQNYNTNYNPSYTSPAPNVGTPLQPPVNPTPPVYPSPTGYQPPAATGLPALSNTPVGLPPLNSAPTQLPSNVGTAVPSYSPNVPVQQFNPAPQQQQFSNQPMNLPPATGFEGPNPNATPASPFGVPETPQVPASPRRGGKGSLDDFDDPFLEGSEAEADGPRRHPQGPRVPVPQRTAPRPPATNFDPLDDVQVPTQQPARAIPGDFDAAPTAQPVMQAVPSARNGHSFPEEHDPRMEKILSRAGVKGLKGFCPVALREDRALVDINPQHSSSYRGQRFQFSSAEAKQKFENEPARYAPAAYGADVVVLIRDKDVVEGMLDYAAWYKGRLYLFCTQANHDEFLADPARFTTLNKLED